MRPEEIAQKREIDEEILHYVRALAPTAPIGAEQVERYLRGIRRRHTLTLAAVVDRLNDLAGRGYLTANGIFEPGQGRVLYYEVTPAARAALDRERPWDWEEATR